MATGRQGSVNVLPPFLGKLPSRAGLALGPAQVPFPGLLEATSPVGPPGGPYPLLLSGTYILGAVVCSVHVLVSAETHHSLPGPACNP